MLIKRVIIFDEIRMAKFDNGIVHNVGDYNIIFRIFLSVNFQCIPLSTRLHQHLIQMVVKWIIWTIPYSISFASHGLIITFDSSSRQEIKITIEVCNHEHKNSSKNLENHIYELNLYKSFN